MGVYEGRGQLSKALKNLMLRWVEARSQWEDSASQHFEEKFIQPIELDLKNAVGAMDHMAAVLAQVRKDCQ
jgi:hypothetical protein